MHNYHNGADKAGSLPRSKASPAPHTPGTDKPSFAKPRPNDPTARGPHTAGQDPAESGSWSHDVAQALRRQFTPLYLKLDSPFRPADWRWQLALTLMDGSLQFVRPYADDAVFSAVEFARHLSRDIDRPEPTAYSDSGLQLAFDVYCRHHRPARWELEARILSGEAAPAIAAKLALPVPAIDWYEKLFFHVSDRRQSRSYIIHGVIGWYDAPRPTIAQLWKVYGFWYGPLVLDGLIYGIRPDRYPTSPAELQDFLAADARQTQNLKENVAWDLLDVTPANSLKVAEMVLHLRLIQQRQAAKGQGVPVDISENLRVFLDELPPHLFPRSEARADSQKPEGPRGPS